MIWKYFSEPLEPVPTTLISVAVGTGRNEIGADVLAPLGAGLDVIQGEGLVGSLFIAVGTSTTEVIEDASAKETLGFLR